MIRRVRCGGDVFAILFLMVVKGSTGVRTCVGVGRRQPLSGMQDGSAAVAGEFVLVGATSLLVRSNVRDGRD